MNLFNISGRGGSDNRGRNNVLCGGKKYISLKCCHFVLERKGALTSFLLKLKFGGNNCFFYVFAMTEIFFRYKILFLDVLFPLDVDKIIFVDADQIVRADLKVQLY